MKANREEWWFKIEDKMRAERRMKLLTFIKKHKKAIDAYWKMIQEL